MPNRAGDEGVPLAALALPCAAVVCLRAPGGRAGARGVIVRSGREGAKEGREMTAGRECGTAWKRVRSCVS